jgi:hypothetical protein
VAANASDEQVMQEGIKRAESSQRMESLGAILWDFVDLRQVS